MPSTGSPRLSTSGISRRRVHVIHRAGTAGENDADRIVAANLLQFGRTGQDNREDVLLANTPRNQLGVLRAEIQDNDGGKRRVFHTSRFAELGAGCKAISAFQDRRSVLIIRREIRPAALPDTPSALSVSAPRFRNAPGDGNTWPRSVREPQPRRRPPRRTSSRKSETTRYSSVSSTSSTVTAQAGRAECSGHRSCPGDADDRGSQAAQGAVPDRNGDEARAVTADEGKGGN